MVIYYLDLVVFDFVLVFEYVGEVYLVIVFVIDVCNMVVEGEFFVIIIDCNGNVLIEVGWDEVVVQQDFVCIVFVICSNFMVYVFVIIGVQVYFNLVVG